MPNITSINTARTDQQTIETLEMLLEEAKSGRLKSLIYIDEYHDGKCGSGWAGTPTLRAIGELERVKFGYFAEQLLMSEE